MMVFGVLVLLNKVQRLLKIGFDLALFLTLEELRAGRHQRLHHTHAVRADAAACFYNLLFSLGTILTLWRNQVKIQVTAALVDVWIAGVILFCALIVRLNIGNLRPFVLGKAKDGKLWLTHLVRPPFLPYEIITQRVGQLHDLFVADALPLQFGRQVGNAV